MSVRNAIISRFLCWTYLREVVFAKSPRDCETCSNDAMSEGIHVDFTSILHSQKYSIGPSSVVRSELGPAPPFPPMRVLEGEWSRALSLVCEVALKLNPLS